MVSVSNQQGGVWVAILFEQKNQFQTNCKVGNGIQTFTADFTTAQIEHTDRNSTVGMYSGRGR